MDERLSKALEFANYQKSLNLERQKLRDWVSANLVYAHNGGIFDLTPEFLSFVKLLVDNDQDMIVILDRNQTPICIKDIQVFYQEVMKKYFELTNEYYHKYLQLTKSRSVEKVVDW